MSQRPAVFGPRGDPSTEVVTPQKIRTREALVFFHLLCPLRLRYDDLVNHDCVLDIESAGRIDTISWYQLWQETNAIFSLCVRKGRTGYSRGCGEIFLECYERAKGADMCFSR